MVAVVALDRLLGDRIHVDRPVGADVDTGSVAAADVVVDRNRPTASPCTAPRTDRP